MPDIFNADIAKKINEALGPKIFDVTLNVIATGTRVNITGGTQPTTVSYTVKGFADSYEENQINGTTIQRGDYIVSILGGSLPDGVVPKPNDTITCEGSTNIIINFTRDPAGAVYQCQVR